GTFSVSSGALVVLDPLCDSEGAIRIDAAHNGEWAVKVIRNSMYGVTYISAACIGAEPWIHGSKSAMLDVDAGMAAIIDAGALRDELGPEDGRVDKFLTLTGGAVGASIMARGAVTRSGQGDGKYPVYAYRDANGLAYCVGIWF
uniref:hypothetical protein n=1 Tax=Megamonas hypermegale TaxID=158847 RepID=UPI0026F0F260